jgi:hypothetical protein
MRFRLTCLALIAAVMSCQRSSPVDSDAGTADADADTDSDADTATDTSPTGGKYLRDIMGTGPDDIYAAGTCGLLLHFDGEQWTEIDLGADDNLNAVWAVAPDNILVGGQRHGEDIDECHGGDGADSGDIGVVRRFNGTEWTEALLLAEPSTAIRALWGAASDDVFAVGYGTDGLSGIHHFDGDAWSSLPVDGVVYPETCGWPTAFTDVWGFSGENLYLVSFEADADDQFSYLVHYVVFPESGCEIVLGDIFSSFFAVWGAASDAVFAVGAGGRVRRFDGSSWNEDALGFEESLFGVWGLGADDVYAVGAGGRAVHYDGVSWSQMETGAAGDLRAVWGTEDAIYAVGDDDAALPPEERSPAVYRYDGESWTRVY